MKRGSGRTGAVPDIQAKYRPGSFWGLLAQLLAQWRGLCKIMNQTIQSGINIMKLSCSLRFPDWP